LSHVPWSTSAPWIGYEPNRPHVTIDTASAEYMVGHT